MEPSDDEIETMLAHLLKEEPESTFTFAEFAQAADFLSPIDE
jgi:hypothetical protein